MKRIPIHRQAEAWLDFYGFLPGEKLEDRVRAYLATPRRCGNADTAMELGRECKWPEKRVSWFVEPDVYKSFEVWSIAFGPALKSWEDVCGIEFVEAEARSNANIYVTAGRIDVAGMTLAWSHLPCGFSMQDQATQRYDTADRGGVYRVALSAQEVIAHEFGHAIGIPHLSRGNLMQPTAAGNIITPKRDDTTEGVARYGPPRGRPAPPPPTTPPPKPPPMDWRGFDWDGIDWSRLNR